MNNYYEKEWTALENEVTRRGGNGAEFVRAMKELYENFDDGAVEWLASLYDPEIGGFYFSESARDNEFIHYRETIDGVVYEQDYLLLPDLESTNQATNFLESTLMIDSYDRLPKEMRDKMKDFVCSLVDPETGFIYHPQWPKNYANLKLARRGRDLMWAEAMAEKFNFTLPYPTANERLRAHAKAEKEKQSAEAETKGAEGLPEYLLTEEAFLAYMKGHDWENRPYWSGNRFAAQALQIKAAGFADVAVGYLNSIQDPETGLWGKTNDYDMINGFLKISCFYRTVGHRVPNVEKAALYCIKCIMSDAHPIHVCTTYNNWFSLHNIILDLRKYGGEEGERKADEIIKKLLEAAPEAIRATSRKIAMFKKKQGCFSYTPKSTSGTSSGMPVAIIGTDEGDINANGICSSGTVSFMLRAFELEKYKVPLFSPNAFDKFLARLGKRKDA